MDWKLAATAFVTMFVAELGDKTQLAALVMSSSANSKLSVFVGAATALVATTGLAVVFGEAISRVIPVAVLPKVAGGLFVALGLWMLLSKTEG